jgi:hypothetical protein
MLAAPGYLVAPSAPSRSIGGSIVAVKRTPALQRLEKKLSRDPYAFFTPAEVQLLAREIRREFEAAFGETDAVSDSRVEDSVRWRPLGARCASARGPHGLRDMAAATRIPQYRLRAIEGGQFGAFRADLAWRYFRSLGIDDFASRWCRANRELADRIGLSAASARRGTS